jgi:DNA-binding transcriptional LysR family regulator
MRAKVTKMTLLSYQVFKTVVEQGSYQAAAKLLNQTPSAISHTISAMEKQMGSRLLVRSKAGVALTNYGAHLLPYINAVLNSDEGLHQAIAEFNGVKRGSVKLGCFSSVCVNWVPDIVRGFTLQYPDISIEIYQGTYDDVVDWLKTGVVDLGFLSQSSAGGLPLTPLCQDPLVCVGPQGFRTGLGHEAVTLEELQGYAFVSQRESCDADIQNFISKYDLQVDSNCHVVDDLSTIAMVAAGMGICLMPQLVMNHISYAVDISPIDPCEYRIIGLSVLNPQYMAPAVKVLHQYIVDHYQAADSASFMSS